MLRGLLKNSGWVLAAKLLGAASAYVLAAVLGQTLGAEAFGRFELSLTVVGIAALFGRLGMDGAWVRHAPGWQSEGIAHDGVWHRVVVTVIGTSLVLGGCLMAFRQGLGEVFGSGVGDDLKWSMLAVPALSGLALAGESFRAAESFRWFAFLQRGTFLMFAALGVWWMAWPPFPTFVAAVAVAACLAIAARSKELHATGGLPPSNQAFNTLSRTAMPMVFAAAAFEVMTWTDTLMCGAWLDEVEVGRYRLAFRLAALLTLGQIAINGALAPRMAQADAAGLRTLVQWAFRWNALIALGGGAFLVVLAPVLPGWFGADFLSVEAVESLRVLGLGTAFNALSGPVLTLMNMTGAERPARNIVVAAAGVNVALNAWAIPRFGIVGAAWATTFTTVLWNVAAGVWVAQRHGIWTWFPFQNLKR